jgi:hypothetical protein
LFVLSDVIGHQNLIIISSTLNCIVLDHKSMVKFSIDMVYSGIFDLVRLLSTMVPKLFCY